MSTRKEQVSQYLNSINPDFLRWCENRPEIDRDGRVVDSGMCALNPEGFCKGCANHPDSDFDLTHAEFDEFMRDR